MQDLKGQLIDYIDYGNDGFDYVIARGLVIDVQEEEDGEMYGSPYLTITTLVNGKIFINEIGAPECDLIQTSDGYQIYNNYIAFD